MTSVLKVLHDRILDSIDAVHTPERFKIVVFDAKTNKIALSACKMSDIMDRNVTLIELLESKRQAYTSLEAIYFLTPCHDSIQRLIDDYSAETPNGKYKAAHILFTARKDPFFFPFSMLTVSSEFKLGPVETNQVGSLEDRLFNRLKQSPVSKHIKALKELFIDFTAIESRVFSFETPSSFFTLYSPSKKSEIPSELDSIAKQLLSVIATFGDYPSIRYFRPPETADGKRTQSMRLATLLQDELEAFMRSNPETAGRQQGQGTVLILDRSVDVAAAILHEFTYQAMANDLLPIEDGSKYTYTVENSSGEMESVSVVIDETDQVFMDIRHAHIVETAGTLTSKFNKFVAENEALRGDKDKAASLRNMKDQLANLPQYQDLKAKYSTHIHIAKECMRIFEEKKINEVGLVEQQLATGETVDGHLPKQILTEIVPLLDDPVVTPMDKLRLLMLYTMCREGLKAEDRERLYDLAKVTDSNADAIKNLGLLGVPVERGGSLPRTKRKPFYARKKADDEEQPFDLSRYITKTKKIVEEHINGTLDATLYPYTTEAPSDSAAEATRSLRKTAQPTWDRKKPNVKGSRLLVFIAGGVTYSEIRAMHELCHSMGRDIIVGSTNIITPRQFILNLHHLAYGPPRPFAPAIPPYQAPAPPPMVSSRNGPPPSKPSSRPGNPPPMPPTSPHRPIAPDYRGGASGPGGMRTIQKDASGRFVAPPMPHGPIPPRSPANTSPQYQQNGAEAQQEKKKGKMFGFI
ncbi:vacuolar sorting protein VPS33/slp1 [Gryganskiella cystojenkinii]|nr:vacuolar sorting protein VPS33/slp1 [Gryganskiella cystojenkinii]